MSPNPPPKKRKTWLEPDWKRVYDVCYRWNLYQHTVTPNHWSLQTSPLLMGSRLSLRSRQAGAEPTLPRYSTRQYSLLNQEGFG